MAGRNRNTFLKRQKEIKRVQKAREKMARRYGKGTMEEGPGAEEPSPEAEALGAGLAEGMCAPDPEAQV